MASRVLLARPRGPLNSHNTWIRFRGAGHEPIDSNTAESFFALLKRGHYGTFRSLSWEHTHRYCDGFRFRWDRRKGSDGERMVDATRGAEDKRLMYG